MALRTPLARLILYARYQSLVKPETAFLLRNASRPLLINSPLIKPRFYAQSKSPTEPHAHNEPHQPATPAWQRSTREKDLEVNVPFQPPGPSGAPQPGLGGSVFQLTGSPLFDAAITTMIGLAMVFVGGIAYVAWYKKTVLDKIELAFAAGYDPALELATHQDERSQPEDDDNQKLLDEIPWTESLRRREQDFIDRIIQGAEQGHYFILLGPKGSGKGSMIFSSMADVAAEGIAMCDAHPDLEVFRLRLGKALNYEFNEDSQTGLFQRRDPREGGAALDIERAMNKLEKVALRCARKNGRPLVLIINNIHFFKNDDDGKNMLLQLQQRAESWAASGILTLVFSTDDFWPFYVMRRSASRMHVVNIYDLDANEALHAAARLRQSSRFASSPQSVFKEVVSIVGGRLAYLSKVTKAQDMLQEARNLMAIEKAWLLSRIGLITDCDDDVMDEQKWSACSWLLLREFVIVRKEQEAECIQAAKSENSTPSLESLPLPVITYDLMTRADFLEELDRINIIAIDVNHDVRPDSVLILRAAREVVEQDGFDDALESVQNRIDEIESLASPAWPVRWMRLKWKGIFGG